MKVEILRIGTVVPIVYDNIEKTYNEDNFYCISFIENEKIITHKHPLGAIFKIIETRVYESNSTTIM